MAIGYIQTNQSLPHAARLVGFIQGIKRNLDGLNDEFKVLEQMKDTTDPQNPVFTQYAVDQYGSGTVAGIQALFDEANSLLAKLNTNAPVSDVNAAILQAAHKTG